uniref:Apolipoprotein N-acyltransferase n=2 Tax=Gloeothece TaxID=28070 RepID=E0UIG2_GLOV7|nr:apolipoprotein N-acyltransferase [Gloeothece verrucosa PCC 7822]
MGLTPAPVSAWFLAWVSLAPLWFLLFSLPLRRKDRQEEDIFKRHDFQESFILGFVWGCGYHGLALSWITGVHPMTWMGVPWLASLAIALFCWFFITFWGAILVGVWSMGMTWINLHLKIKWLRVLMGVALWCGLESLWSQGDLWWTSLSYTQSPHNLLILQLGQLSGSSTITASIVAVNGLFAEILLAGLNNKFVNYQKTFALLSLPIAIIFILHLTGFFLYNRPLVKTPNTAIKVGLIQGNIPNQIKLYPQGWKKAIEGYTKGYKALADEKVDIILTPETALPFFWKDIVNFSSFYRAILDKKVPTWLGAFGQQGTSFTNSLFTVTGTGTLFSRYDKVKLVPLGEYIPFEEILGGFINRLSPLDAHLARGKSDQIFDTPFGRAIVGICYESAFSEHFRRQAALGGEFIITASNNAHYSQTMPAQHHAQDVMRAVETDRWAARATNTGYSAIVDPKGRTLWISDINTYEIHSDIIYRQQTKTLYVTWGDWLTKIVVILAITIGLVNGFMIRNH